MSGQVALVTGSSRGIGLATALALGRAGFSVAVNGPARDEELEGALETVRAAGVTAVAAPFDRASRCCPASHGPRRWGTSSPRSPRARCPTPPDRRSRPTPGCWSRDSEEDPVKIARPCFVDCFKRAARNGPLRDPEQAARRMKALLAMHGV